MPLEFRPLSLDLQRAYIELLRASRTNASDYSFANIWGWAEEYELRWAWQHDLVWIRQNRPRECLWAPIGPWQTIDWARRMAPLFDSGLDMIRVPEPLANRLADTLGPRIRTESLRDHWDYLYDVQELVALKGNRFHKKKNLLNQFVRNNEFQFRPMSPEIIRMALEMQEEWCLWRDCESSETLSAENRAISRVFRDWDSMAQLIGGALMVEGAPVAYTVAEALSEDTLVVHFEKGCTGFKGIYQAINQVFLEHAAAGFSRVNREQDLGDPGLRKAKESYHPVDFVKKYRVSSG